MRDQGLTPVDTSGLDDVKVCMFGLLKKALRLAAEEAVQR